MFQMSIRAASLVLLCMPCVRAAGQVHVVAPSGAPFTKIQAAIAASSEGDTVLVKAGTYAGFDVQGKSLTLCADPEGSATLTSRTRLLYISSDQQIVLTGFLFTATQDGGIRVEGCSGNVRLEALTALAATVPVPNSDAVSLAASENVAIVRCNLTGGTSAYGSGNGLLADHSRVALYDSLLFGAHGSTNGVNVWAGGAGCFARQWSMVFASGCTLTGGDGSDGTPGYCSWPYMSGGGGGASGGPGVLALSGITVMLAGTSLIGGQGGQGGSGTGSPCNTPAGLPGPAGPIADGMFSTLTSASRSLTAPTVVRELAPLPVSVSGVPGDQVWIQIGSAPTWAFDFALSGVRLVSTAQRSTRLFLGTLPGSGTLTTTLVFPDMGPGVQARTRHMQALFRDATGQSFLGSGAVFTLLDSAF